MGTTNWSEVYSGPAEMGYDPVTLMPFRHTVTDCSHVFDQASVSGTWALQVETNWTASYVNSEGGGGGLEAQTAATTVDVPVAEVQTLVRS